MPEVGFSRPKKLPHSAPVIIDKLTITIKAWKIGTQGHLLEEIQILCLSIRSAYHSNTQL